MRRCRSKFTRWCRELLAGPSIGARSLAGRAGRVAEASIRQTMLLPQEPAIDDVPLVSSPGLEIQQRRFAVLEFKIEFQRFSPGRAPSVDGLREQPALPLAGDQGFCFFLF